ncbi:MAG TPA: nucleotide modification associated domain-containing protein, partial [Draconibacterium sp.]|nr:nucleotide modification associated domain-containing protein [Draconibacterium sp.]
FIGIINYCIMGLIQLELGPSDEDIPNEKIQELYDTYFNQAKILMMDKNHDYGEAWRNMRISSYTDLILMKIQRTKQIENNQGKTLISEGIDANYMDMINYAVFAMIKIEFENEE